MRKLALTITAIAGMLSLAAEPGLAQNFPSKPMRIVVPFAAGGSPDVIARVIGEGLRQELGQPVVVDNRPGAGGSVAAEHVLQQPADGYTLFLGTTGNMATNKSLYKQLRFDPETDFLPLSLAYVSSNVLIVRSGSDLKSVSDVIAKAKAQPGKLSFGSPGIGTAGHLVGELFNKRSGVELIHVPYRGQPQVVADLIGGQIDFSFEAIGTAIPAIQQGQVRGLAITTKERSGQLPDVPTFAEAGIGDFDLQAWAMLAAHARTPMPIAEQLNRAIVKVVHSQAVLDRINGLGVQAKTSTITEAQALHKEEVQRWRTIIDLIGFQKLD